MHRGFRAVCGWRRLKVFPVRPRIWALRRMFCALVMSGPLSLFIGCRTPQPALAGTPFDPELPPKYVLQPGDKLMISHASAPQLDREVLIRTDGMISLPHVNDIQAALRSPAELTDELNERYADVLARPASTVIVKEESGRHIFIGGEVQSPGAMTLRPNQTLIQALFEGGGLTMEAHRKGVLVMRATPRNGVHVLRTDVNRILAGVHPDVRLQPLDIVFVPASAIAKVGRFVEQYINRVVPRAFSFPFSYELHQQPIRLSDNQAAFPVEITRPR